VYCRGGVKTVGIDRARRRRRPCHTGIGSSADGGGELLLIIREQRYAGRRYTDLDSATGDDGRAEIAGCSLVSGIRDRDREVEDTGGGRHASKIPVRIHRDSWGRSAGGNAPAVRRGSAGRGEDFAISGP